MHCDYFWGKCYPWTNGFKCNFRTTTRWFLVKTSKWSCELGLRIKNSIQYRILSTCLVRVHHFSYFVLGSSNDFGTCFRREIPAHDPNSTVANSKVYQRLFWDGDAVLMLFRFVSSFACFHSFFDCLLSHILSFVACVCLFFCRFSLATKRTFHL